MLEILRKFFRFCDERERSEFYRSIVLGVLAALFSALKIPAIGVMLQAILVEGVTAKTILLSLAVMLISVIGSSILKYRATALQTDGGYSTTANKRVQIAEHLRYLPMGYFNENSLGAITSVTTNTMDNLSGVSTRVVMLVTEGIFSTAVMTLAVFLFDWRVGLFIIAGLAVYYAVNHALQIRSEQTTRRKFAGDTAVVEQVLEFIKGIAEVKSYSLIGRYNRRLEDTIEENVNANTDMELKLLPLMLTQNVVAKLIDMGVVVLSLILYTGGRMELLNCVMLCICSFLLTEGLEQAGTQSSLLRVVDTCVDQAADILDLPAMDISGAELMFYNLERIDLLKEYEGRLLIEWGKSALAWAQKGTNEKPIVAIRDKKIFSGYENAILTYEELREIVQDPTAYESWHTALSTVNAVYLIVDRENGRKYVGSAYGKGGLLGRWTHYVKSLHGDNKLMKELLCDYPDRYTHFQFSILQLLPKAVTPDEVIQTETLWKKKLLTYEPLGMNAN